MCKRNSQEKVIQKFVEIHGDKYDYTKVIYVSTDKKVIIICKKHGIFKKTPWYHIHGEGCPSCSSSYGEQRIERFLKKNNIEFNKQKRFNTCRDKRPLPFDFYLQQYNMLIEYDGPQHFHHVEGIIKGNYDEYLLIKYHDNIKDTWSKENNIDLLRISYLDRSNIEKIIENKINSKEMYK